MATLESGFNPTYSENASILTGNPNRVAVEVEDTIDRDFWSDLLEELCPEKEFHFDPYHTILNEDGSSERTGKGKSQILNASEDFNAWHIGCVDSDYDWILSDYTDAGKTISGNKYLLQTYAYSIENLMCLSCTLEDFCRENTEEATEFDFDDYLTRLSKAVYPLLVWSTYLCSKGNQDFTQTSWREVLVNTEKDPEASLAIIEAKAKAKIEEFDKKYADKIIDKEDFEFQNIGMKDITEDDAYLYLRGHELFDQILNSVLVPLIIELRNQHRETIKASNLGDEVCKNTLREYQGKVKPVKPLLSKNFRYKHNTLIYDKIWADVMQIWE
jgi:hypothetical protein